MTHESATVAWSGMDDASYQYCIADTNIAAPAVGKVVKGLVSQGKLASSVSPLL